MRYIWLAFFCAAPLWAQTSAKNLQEDVDFMQAKAEETKVYRQVYALSAGVFADEKSSAGLKIELMQTITLPALERILEHFAQIKKDLKTPEGQELVDKNTAVVEKLKEAYTLYLQGLRTADAGLKAKANVMAAVEAPSLSALAEEYSARLKTQYRLKYR